MHQTTTAHENRDTELGTPTSVLDDALDRVSVLEFPAPSHYVSHAPMACEALVALGLPSAVPAWVEYLEATLVPGVDPVRPDWPEDLSWRQLLGDSRLLPQWMGYFDRCIDDQGWGAVVAAWVPRLMPGLQAALFHGVIRTSHAVRALQDADTASRRTELARALGHWAVWFSPGAPGDEATAFDDDPASAVLVAATDGARCYVTSPTIFNLHGVTGAMAVHLLSGHLADSDARAAARQLRAAHRLLSRGVPAASDTGDDGWDDGTVSAASASYDAHQVKLVEACRRGFRDSGEPVFARAAQVVTNPGR